MSTRCLAFLFAATLMVGGLPRRADAFVCGNHILEPGEQCDDGNIAAGDGCSPSCQRECGNLVLDPGEQCDDGNLASGDGCSATCQLETVFCGNGVREPGEQCDDGNTISGDGCSAICKLEFPCPMTGRWQPNGAFFTNNIFRMVEHPGGEIVGFNETDQSSISGTRMADSVSLSLPPFAGFPLSGQESSCSAVDFPDGAGPALVGGGIFRLSFDVCGDGFVGSGEECDDGNFVGGDGCGLACDVEVCGNRIVDAGEECDDGNRVNGDGCDNNCTTPRCGNGIVTQNEQCDDGNRQNGDGCDENCGIPGCPNGVVDPGEECDDGNLTDNDGCARNCRLQGCGNGIVENNEGCDDGNVIDGDGCDSNCTPTGCGNGVLTAGEECDDGNTTAGDCCSPSCQAEVAGTPCEDGNVCTVNDACQAGTCVGTPSVSGPCDDGNPCTSGDVCSSGTCAGVPIDGCNPGFSCSYRYDCRRPTASFKAALTLKDNSSDDKDQIIWKWTSGAATSKPEFSDPQSTAGYLLCLFDESTNPLATIWTPSGGLCSGKPCWSETKSGFRLRNRSAASIQSLDLVAGTAGRSKISIRGRGAGLSMPQLPLSPRASVQLSNVETGVCWGADHTLVLVGRSNQFKAKGN